MGCLGSHSSWGSAASTEYDYCSLGCLVILCATPSGQSAMQQALVVDEVGYYGRSLALALVGQGRYQLHVLLADVQHRSQGPPCGYGACQSCVARQGDQLYWPQSGVGGEPVTLGVLLQDSQLLLCDSWARDPGYLQEEAGDLPMGQGSKHRLLRPCASEFERRCEGCTAEDPASCQAATH
jgi:hypothetical protein